MRNCNSESSVSVVVRQESGQSTSLQTKTTSSKVFESESEKAGQVSNLNVLAKTLSTPDWEGYKGELQYNGDGVWNKGAMLSLLQQLQTRSNSKSQKTLELARKKWYSGEFLPRMTLNNLQFHEIVKSGSFGQVAIATLASTQKVAVKQFFCSHRTMFGPVEMIVKERDMLIYLKSKEKSRIVNIIGAFFEQHPCIVMELCVGDCRIAMGKISPKGALRYTIQILEGLKYIHQRGIWHLDLRLENILITAKNNVKIADFGNAMLTSYPFITEMKTHHRLGCAWYCDWEANTEMRYSSKTDVWALACVIYALDTGKRLMQVSGLLNPLEYGAIAKYGHTFGSRSDGFARVSLASFCEQQKCRFSSLLRHMLTPTWEGRLEAAQLLESVETQHLCNMYGLQQDNLDNEPISLEPLTTHTYQPFEHPPKIGISASSILELTSIYYDEMDNDHIKNIPVKICRPVELPDASEWTNPISNIETLRQLIQGIAANDPLTMGQFLCETETNSTTTSAAPVSSTPFTFRSTINPAIPETNTAYSYKSTDTPLKYTIIRENSEKHLMEIQQTDYEPNGFVGAASCGQVENEALNANQMVCHHDPIEQESPKYSHAVSRASNSSGVCNSSLISNIGDDEKVNNYGKVAEGIKKPYTVDLESQINHVSETMISPKKFTDLRNDLHQADLENVTPEMKPSNYTTDDIFVSKKAPGSESLIESEYPMVRWVKSCDINQPLGKNSTSPTFSVPSKNIRLGKTIRLKPVSPRRPKVRPIYWTVPSKRNQRKAAMLPSLPTEPSRNVEERIHTMSTDQEY